MENGDGGWSGQYHFVKTGLLKLKHVKFRQVLQLNLKIYIDLEVKLWSHEELIFISM